MKSEIRSRRAFLVVVALTAASCSQRVYVDHSGYSYAGKAQTVAAHMADFKFTPNRFATVDSNYDITLDLKNDGTVVHNFSIPSLNIDQDVPIGATSHLGILVSRSGTYVFFCKYHRKRGLVGTIFVRGIQPSASTSP